jgi:DNA repair protein RadC
MDEKIEHKIMIRDLPEHKKPREKMAERGVESLKDHELLAILLGSGYHGQNVLKVSKRLLSGYSLEEFVKLPLDKLKKLKGIGPAKACLIKAAHELNRRALENDLLPPITSPTDVVKEVANIRNYKKENFIALYLNARNQVIHKETISIGSLSANVVHPREVFKPAIEKSAASIVLVHNHPSGDPTPSNDDIELTKRIIDAGKIMDIDVYDHIIIGDKDYVSLKEKGLI